MLIRVVTVFVALLMCWSGLMTQERSVGLGGADEVAVTQGSAPDSGSVDEHYLDDQPAQSWTDAAADSPDWFPAPDEFVVTSSSRRMVSARITSPQHTFSADTPRRPPRAA